MAQPTNTFDTYDQVGRREYLTNEIALISPTETPFLSSLERESVTSTKFKI